jgi:N-acetylglucosaminyldiphosphoundecaprenol N-acetyl-beta-D-mannosaminyltransferase
MSTQAKFPKYLVQGVEIDALTMPQAIDYIVSAAADPASRPFYVIKPYVEFIDQARRQPQLKPILNQAELSIPDGVALNWAVTYLYGGRRNLIRWLATLASIVLAPKSAHRLLPERAAGTNLTWPLLEAAAAQTLRVFLVGTPNHGRGDIGRTAKFIRARLPKLNIVGYYGGFFPPGNEAELLTQLKDCRPDLILVGMGFPRQEQLMAKLAPELGHGVFIGEGGTFDYTSFGGKEAKAPRFLQTIGLEWLWRLVHDPARWRRQLAIPRYIWSTYIEGKTAALSLDSVTKK